MSVHEYARRERLRERQHLRLVSERFPNHSLVEARGAIGEVGEVEAWSRSETVPELLLESADLLVRQACVLADIAQHLQREAS